MVDYQYQDQRGHRIKKGTQNHKFLWLYLDVRLLFTKLHNNTRKVMETVHI